MKLSGAPRKRERERRDRDIPRIRSLCLCSSWGLAPTKLPPPRIFFIKINALESLSLTKLRVIIRISLGLSLSVGDRQKIVLYEKRRTIVCGERGLIENYKNCETRSRRVSLTKGEASVREEVQKRRGEEERKILCRATVAHFWVSLTVARVALRLLPFHAGQIRCAAEWPRSWTYSFHAARAAYLLFRSADNCSPTFVSRPRLIKSHTRER